MTVDAKALEIATDACRDYWQASPGATAKTARLVMRGAVEAAILAYEAAKPAPAEPVGDVREAFTRALNAAFANGLSEGEAQLLVRCAYAKHHPETKGYIDED